MGKRLSYSSSVWIGHHIHATLRVVAVETESDMGEVFELKERLQDLKNDTGHRIDAWDGKTRDLLVQTVVDHDIEQLTALALVRVLLKFQSYSVQVRGVDSWQGELPCVGSLEASFEGLKGWDVQWVVQVRAVEI